MNAKKLIFEFLGGLIGSGIGFAILATLLQIPGISRLETYLGGDKAGIFVGLFLGFPIGSIAGICLLDRLAFKAESCNGAGIVAGLALSIILGGICTVILLGKLGSHAVFIAPFLFVILALAGYSTPLFR